MPGGMTAPPRETLLILRWESEGGSLPPARSLPGLYRTGLSASVSPRRFFKLRNDDGIAEIQIGMREFECIGALAAP